MQDQETIIAQCTPLGAGALALLRISGDNAVEVAARISKLASGHCLSDLPTHTIHYGWVVDSQGVRIDNVLFLLMHAPHTFTGENTIEITCHNNPFIIERIIELAIEVGARVARNGEFSYRAVLNNKIDIVQAESINDLVHANTQMALKQALSQVNGSFSRWIRDLEEQLVKVLALCEASFEFLDEEMTFDAQIIDSINAIVATIERLKVVFDKQRHIRQGIRIALIGSVNVGKSSLFNALIGTKRAIVTPIPGTTRDSIEAGLYRDGAYWTLIDTAGLRETEDSIECEGIERSHEQAALADIVLLVFDGSRLPTSAELIVYQELRNKYAHKLVPVRNKIDLPECTNTYTWLGGKYQDANTGVTGDGACDSIGISAAQGIGLDALQEAIGARMRSLVASAEAPFLLNKRHYNILLVLEKDLRYVHSLLRESQVRYELVSYHVTAALAQCAELTGKSISEQGMDAVFREFCVGK